MPSSWFENRAVLAAVVVAVSGIAALSIPVRALAQSASQISPSSGADAPQTSAAPSSSEPLLRSPRDALALPPPPDARRDGSEAQKPPIYVGSANYGKPRKKSFLPKPYPPPPRLNPAPFSPQNPLPPLEPYRTSAQARAAARRLKAQQFAQRLALRPTLPPPPTVAVSPTLPVRPRPKIEERPYDPLGVGIGSLRLRPYLETSYGYDTNPNRLMVDPRGSRYFRTDAGFAVVSEWSRHNFEGDMRFGYWDYPNYQSASRVDGNANVKARYDITRDTAIVFDAKFDLSSQNPGSPNLVFNLGNNVVVINRPFILTMASTLGLRQKFNRLEITLRGSFERQMYQDALLSDGTTLDLSSTDYNGYGGVLRASYEISPNLKPFVESKIDSRIHDTPVDVFGYYRDSHGVAVKGGAEFRISELLKGEAAVGYAERKYADIRLPKLPGTTVDASLTYMPSALTTVTLRAATNFYETTLGGAAGVLNRTFSAQISHDFTRNFNATALASYYTNNYVGSTVFERGFSGGVKLEYKMTRSISIRASYTHEKLSSTTINADYTANVYLVGLRFQL